MTFTIPERVLAIFDTMAESEEDLVGPARGWQADPCWSSSLPK